MPNWIGDSVCATPIIAALRRAYPQAKITAMCRGHIASLFARDPAIDALFSFSPNGTLCRREDARNLRKKLRMGQYDLGLLLTHSFSSAWQFWTGKVKKRVGFNKDGRRLFLTTALALPKQREHIVATYQRLLAPLGIQESMSPPKLYVTDKEKQEARRFLAQYCVQSDHVLIGVHPGAAYGSAKCWLPERFRALSERLLACNPSYVLLFLGSVEQKELIQRIAKDLPARVVTLAGQTNLRQLMALMTQLDVLVTNDSGPMHIADGLAIPVVALFGSTDPRKTHPYRQKESVISVQPACAPCFQRVCPIDLRCMKGITVDRVFDRVLAQLNKKR